jgi:hypothetical protein
MTRQVTLTVNDVPIKLDDFVGGYVEHVLIGIVGSLRGTGEIKHLELTVEDSATVRLRFPFSLSARRWPAWSNR